MKTAVIYQSTSGFTQKYAQWISEALKCSLYRHNEITRRKLQEYDTIIYGGSLHAAGISGLNRFKKKVTQLSEKRIIIFTTGASPVKSVMIDEILDHNFTPEEKKRISFFYFRGGFDFKKLNWPNKILMTLLKWKLQIKKERSSDENGMLNAYSHPADFTKKDNIKPLLELIQTQG